MSATHSPALAATTGPAEITAHDWGWRYDGRMRWSVRGLDLRIAPGERVLLLGPSGSGKSTLLAALAGVLGTDAGESEGRLAIDTVNPDRARGRAGLVLQDPDAQVILARVGDDAAFGCENLGVPRDELWPRVRAALATVGLGYPLDHPTARLSGGEKQRLALAGVVAMGPGLILLDEPTANLDPDGVAAVRRAVAEVAERTGATLIVVEHRVDIWCALTSRTIVLGPAGECIADGATEDVLTSQADFLAGVGVWVPGVPLPPDLAASPDPTPPPDGAGSAPLLRVHALAAGWPRSPVVSMPHTLDFPAGSSTVITGPNGSGKTTLLLTLGGLLAPRGGRLEAGELLARGRGPTPSRWRSRDLATRIGTVFQSPEHQFTTSTVRAELGVATSATPTRINELLERFRLAPLAAANPFTLSGGEKRRLALAAVLAGDPTLLLCDEPTFGQDRLTWIDLVRTLRAFHVSGGTLAAVSHDADLVTALGQRHYVLAPTPTPTPVSTSAPALPELSTTFAPNAPLPPAAGTA